ncbi:unnamed protein product [Rotaria magnacalcarata]|uniref:Carrier domain-containing protein n=1 Tax=Rotaria magnacalcarata TaxID=392030 RepID=A0A8S2P818_9BILA|nr:unnamed protein product [Rotaria magnacalcarata]
MEFLRSLPFSSIAGALEYQAQTRPEKPAILYPDSSKNSREYTSLTYRQYNNVVNDLADKISKYLPFSSSDEPVTCGLLAIGGIEYIVSQYALMKVPNVIMFPISARNSQAAVEHLLRQSKTVLLITTLVYLPMVKIIQEKEEFQLLKVIVWEQDEFKIEEFIKNKDVEHPLISDGIVSSKSKDEILNKVVIILHSSGSTAFPKPIRITNRYFLISLTLYLTLEKHFWVEDDVVLVWGALFHLMAFNVTVRALLVGCAYALPLCVTFPPKPDELLRNIQVKNNITILVTVPSLLEHLIRELLSKDNSYIGLKPLEKLKYVMYAGAGCPEALCRTLVDSGVVLISVYGSTETGIILIKNYKPYDKKWKFMEIPEIRKPFLRIETPPNAQNPNEKLIFHLPNDPFLAENISTSLDDCYTAGDILLEDPPNSGQYFILGRQDDTLVHVNGEKTNPIPMEDVIRHSPLVQQVVIVGHNQFCTAALVQLNIGEASNYDFQEIEEKIWEVVERANKEAPSHSRLVRQLVKILPMNKTLPVTEKGNLTRQKINQEYATLISTIYDKFLNQQYQEQQKHGTTQEKEQTKWTEEKIKKYLEEELKLLDQKINDFSRSIFDFGVNSLQVVELRNLICQDICEIPKNFLYENSSIEHMSSKLFDEEHLGQTDSICQELQNEVTDIIHTAWKMNFNQTVKDFEHDSIFGVYNLLKLAASNHIQFHFISSIASAASGLLSSIKEEPLPRKSEIALPQGYGQSKYASEHLCWAAMNLWNVPVNIYRVGQVSGDTQNGVWNTTEMAAMMIYAGAGQLKQMPNIGHDINWIPVDVCSASLVDLALKSSFDLSTGADQRVYHLLNPRVISYENYLSFLQAAGLDFHPVSPKEFVNTILTTKDLSNPLIKLSSFLEQIFSKKDTSKSSKYETVKTVERCEILKNCPTIDANLIKLYLNHWKKCQVLKD